MDAPQEGVDWGPDFGILDVQPSVLTALKTTLTSHEKAVTDPIDQMRKDVDDLAKTWKGPNHDRFVKYFDERYEVVALYRDFVSAHAEMLEKINGLYGKLEGTIDDEIRKSLKAAAAQSGSLTFGIN